MASVDQTEVRKEEIAFQDVNASIRVRPTSFADIGFRQPPLFPDVRSRALMFGPLAYGRSTLDAVLPRRQRELLPPSNLSRRQSVW